MNDLKENRGTILWSADREAYINTQITIELVNFMTYEALGCYFRDGKIGYNNMSTFLRGEADEELKHARQFMDYQTMRGGTVVLDDIKAKDISSVRESSSPCLSAYRLALQLEKDTYANMLTIHEQSGDDPHLQDFLEECMGEQLHGQKDLNDKIRVLETATNNMAEYLHEINLSSS